MYNLIICFYDDAASAWHLRSNSETEYLIYKIYELHLKCLFLYFDVRKLGRSLRNNYSKLKNATGIFSVFLLVY